MATVSSLGIGSGLDLSGIVSGLVAAERAPTENRLNAKEANLTTELSAFGALKSSLSLFQGALSSLKSSSTFNSKVATVSDSSVLTTFAASFADQGSYEVEVTALAKAHSLATSATTAFDSVDDTVGTGTLNIQFGTTVTEGGYTFTPDTSKAAKVITVSEENNNTTLSGLTDYINNNDFGIQASIVNDGSGYRLTLTSQNSGAKNSMEITVSDDGGSNTDNVGLSQLAFNADAQTSMIQTVQAQDTLLNVNGLEISRETRSVTGAIDGVTLNLLKADVGNIITVDVSSDSSGVVDSVQQFVDGYNGLVETINALTSYDTVEGTGGILIGDFTVRSIGSQLRAALSDPIKQADSQFNSLADIGIKAVKGFLQIDTTDFNKALQDYPDDVESIFSLQGRASSSGVSYSSATDATLQGNYDVNITAMATQGAITGTTLDSLIINADNDTFSLSVDGIFSDTITLAQATYNTEDELAAHIQAQINDDVNLKAAGASVQVTYDSNADALSITSLRYGSASSVDMLSIDTNTTADLGFATSPGTVGQDVAGTINGFSAEGNGQILTSTIGDSRGLALSITSGDIGDRGSLNFSRGLMSSLDNLLSSFLGDSGSISSREDNLNSELDSLVDERGKLETRIQSLESRLIQQFSALDSLIASFNATSSYLEQQLQNLPKPNSIGNN